ncbi:hypothetical protein ACO2Q3_13740 [Caulobacter sp. KR2-114]|uniref:hypothetical protein n=1 Tax=Caulobacter sp. KR2-114 TaxID=3400912 RepID=UPI003C04F752
MSHIPPASRVVAIPTAATDAFLRWPRLFVGRSANQILRIGEAAKANATLARRRHLEAALERLEDLRESLIAKLDAIDGEPDFEDEGLLEECADAEPTLGSIGRLDQRFWALGDRTDLEVECDDEGAPEFELVPGYADPIDQTSRMVFDAR